MRNGKNTIAGEIYTRGAIILGVCIACGATLQSCARSSPTGGVTTQGASTSPSSWVGGVTLGTPSEAVRSIGSGPAQFRHGETIQLRVDAASAPANAQIHVSWLREDGGSAGEESRAGHIGGDIMTFNAPVNLAAGDYRVEVKADGRLVHDQRFEVLPATAAND